MWVKPFLSLWCFPVCLTPHPPLSSGSSWNFCAHLAFLTKCLLPSLAFLPGCHQDTFPCIPKSLVYEAVNACLSMVYKRIRKANNLFPGMWILTQSKSLVPLWISSSSPWLGGVSASLSWETGIRHLHKQSVHVLIHFGRVKLFATLWTIAYQALLSMGFSRQEYWSGWPCPPPGDLPNPGIKPMSLTSSASAGEFLTTSATWEIQSSLSWVRSQNPRHTTGQKELQSILSMCARITLLVFWLIYNLDDSLWSRTVKAASCW